MAWRSNRNPNFRSKFSEDIFNQKYAHEGCETWSRLSATIVLDVCKGHMPADEMVQLAKYIDNMWFLPGGRYLYYAGRPNSYWNNCYLLRSEEDTREDWADLSWKAESCLMTGGGIGNDYSVYRAEGTPIKRTGGTASGPLSKACMINEIGRRVMQGGSRRSAIYASLNWRHADIDKWIKAKTWKSMMIPGTDISLWDAKQVDQNFPAPLDMTNMSVNYDDAWLRMAVDWGDFGEVFKKNVKYALMTGEPGFSFNFGAKERETLRNACCEVTSEDDSDVCNLGSLNLGRIPDIDTLRSVVDLATRFLLCGTLGAKLPYEKVYKVREKNRRLGLGLMGIHEWLLARGYRYEVTPELHKWLEVYEGVSDHVSQQFADHLGVSRPVANRAVAPTGTIGIMAGTSTGIEPLFAAAYKRRYLKNGTQWHHQFVVDPTARDLAERYGVEPDAIETALGLASEPERRIKFQYDIQGYVDQAISSTINLPAWGTDLNNDDRVEGFAALLAKYASGLRGFTVYPDGARGGQPLTAIPYADAVAQEGVEFKEHDICDITQKGGTCGV